MKVGKLPPEMLGNLLSKVKLDSRVVVGPSVGVDAAVIDCGDRLLVAKTDPITFAADEIGWYAVRELSGRWPRSNGPHNKMRAMLQPAPFRPKHRTPDRPEIKSVPGAVSGYAQGLLVHAASL